MTIPCYRIFFDTSVYIAALLSPKGAAGELIHLAEAGAVTMVVSEGVIIESDQVIGRKFPDLVPESRRLWKSISPEIADEPSSGDSAEFRKKLQNNGALILSAAHHADVAAFVTWDTRDFLNPAVKSLVSFPIVTPGDCIKLFRKWIDPFLD